MLHFRARSTATSGPVTGDRHALPGAVPGLALVLVIAAGASLLGRALPVIGGPVFGIVAGMALAPLLGGRSGVRQGATIASHQVLQASIVALGLGLSLRQIGAVGIQSLPVMLGTLALALVAAWVLGRLLRIGGDLTVLIGVGTAICGASAIAATTAVIKAADSDVVYAISTIFLFNVVAVLLYPIIGHALGLPQSAFGLWVGTAVNDTSSVVAAGYTYGATAGAHAVVVKLTRTLMIIPIVLVLQAWRLRADGHGSEGSPRVGVYRLVPWFIPMFLVAATLNTVGAVPVGLQPWITQLAAFMITVALVGVGLSARFGAMRRTGPRPVLLGAALWAVVGVTGLALQALTGQL